ncbi:hypothetical protein CEXT_186311 [Caerostris extrusa]|uniref:Uncharacterized protein n=1 Tax=Caerostris extrusa TaxID=172846 RepID=A0AAV4XT14_CAEEX|nr:hypothetical protein CEXT_186311 [Caerostris extrusa]
MNFNDKDYVGNFDGEYGHDDFDGMHNHTVVDGEFDVKYNFVGVFDDKMDYVDYFGFRQSDFDVKYGHAGDFDSDKKGVTDEKM